LITSAIIRGIDAAASLKHVERERDLVVALIIRGIGAAASLKPVVAGHPAKRGPESGRGKTLAANPACRTMTWSARVCWR